MSQKITIAGTERMVQHPLVKKKKNQANKPNLTHQKVIRL